MSEYPKFSYGGQRRVETGPAGPRVPTTLWRGFRGRCPACGEGRLFDRFLKTRHVCASCGLELHHHRADDFPPYIVMFAVGHLLGYGVYFSETHYDDIPLWFHLALWPTLAVVLSLSLLQPAKGAVVGLQYALGMHGFGSRPQGPGGGLAETGLEPAER